MSTRFPPAAEGELITFSENFKAKIVATPQRFSLQQAQATAYGLLHDAFVSAHNTANAPLTRSSTNISLKNDAKRALLTNLRLLAGIVQQAPGMTNSLRDELGLSPRGLARTPIPPPTMAPGMELQTSETVANVVTVRLSDPESPRRGKPDGVGSAAVYSFTGETPPTSLAGWNHEGTVTRNLVDVRLPSTLAPGTKVWFTACWLSPTSQPGPLCTPVATHIQYGGLPKAA